MSVSRHPIALRLEQQVGEGVRLLATVMALPLVDGIFPALVLAGALTYPFGMIETGLLIFGGSATVAVILAEMDGSRREQVRAILLLGAVLVPLAAVEAAVAPTIQSVLDMGIFQRFAGLVILTVAAKTASAKIGEYLPRPAVIIGLGLVASFQPTDAMLEVTADPILVAKAAGTAGIGVAFALAVALLGPRLRGSVDIDRFRFGSSVALGMLSLSVLQLMPTEAPVALGVLIVTAVFAFDPSVDGDIGLVDDEDAPDATDVVPVDDGDDDLDIERPPAPSAVADGGDRSDHSGEVEYGYPSEEGSRAPWL
jgi:hypothetical protein